MFRLQERRRRELSQYGVTFCAGRGRVAYFDLIRRSAGSARLRGHWCSVIRSPAMICVHRQLRADVGGELHVLEKAIRLLLQCV
jgi:hypothetical protein